MYCSWVCSLCVRLQGSVPDDLRELMPGHVESINQAVQDFYSSGPLLPERAAAPPLSRPDVIPDVRQLQLLAFRGVQSELGPGVSFFFSSSFKRWQIIVESLIARFRQQLIFFESV